MQVKCTQAIKESIEVKINSMFESRTKHALAWENYGMSYEEICARIVAKLCPSEHRVMIDALGPTYFDSLSEVRVKFSISGPDYCFKLPKPILGISAWNSYYNSVLIRDPDLAKIEQQRKEASDLVLTEKTKFVRQVNELYDQAPSINALIKVWPPIVNLLDSDVIERVNRKTERTSAKKLAANVNVNDLSASLLVAKVAQ